MRLIKMQSFRTMKRPWVLLFLVVIIAIYFWMAVSPLRNATSYSVVMNRYGEMKPENVAIAVLGEARPDLTLDEIYDEFIASQSDWLYVRSFVNSSSGMAWISCLMAAFFLCRDLGENSVRPILIAGYKRSSVFIWLVVRYFIFGILITVITLAFVRMSWRVHLGSFPKDYVFSTQMRYLLYSLYLFSYPMLLAFLLKNPILSAVGSFILVLILTRVCNLFPSFSPMSVIPEEEHWLMTTGPDVYMHYVIAAIVIIVVCITASYLVFRRRDA